VKVATGTILKLCFTQPLYRIINAIESWLYICMY